LRSGEQAQTLGARRREINGQKPMSSSLSGADAFAPTKSEPSL
jgi:hypothetical protein